MVNYMNLVDNTTKELHVNIPIATKELLDHLIPNAMHKFQYEEKITWNSVYNTTKELHEILAVLFFRLGVKD